MSIDLAKIGRELKKPIENIETAVTLLDEGNTIPFITRFRKDQTGGLTEEQLAVVKSSVAKLRALAERRAFISKSIDSQGKLDEKIARQIEAADTSRELEDIYHAFKPKKQTLATAARQNGLEPLALDIFEGREPDVDLATRATEFVRVDKNLNSVDDVIAGVGHILAERFSDNTALRNELRTIIGKGKLTTKLIEVEESTPAPRAAADAKTGNVQPADTEADESAADPKAVDTTTDSATAPNESSAESSESSEPAAADTIEQTPASLEVATSPVATAAPSTPKTAASDGAETVPDSADSDADAAVSSAESATAAQTAVAAIPKAPAKKKKKKKKKKIDDPYKEFHEFSHPIAKMPYYKTLAINRGEKNGRLKVKIQVR